jgi:hypothetical protein
METAYTDAMARTNPTATELGAGNIGGMILAPGLYKWSTGVTIPSNVTLSGSANDVWIFQIAQNLNISSAVRVVLSGGAQSSNIFWAVAGQATLGTTSVFNGNILSQTAIVLNTGVQLNGRALAQTAVTLDSSLVTIPAIANEASPTATVAQSPTPVTITITPATITTPAITMTSTSTGCSGGNKYNTSNGQICVNNTVRIPSYNFGNTTLKNGSNGNAVMELQRFLNAKLNLGLLIDGKLGQKTIAVIKKWQKNNNLVSDGIVGVKTKIKMNVEAQTN